MSGITRAEVAHLAHLARLRLAEEEIDHFAGQLDVILQSVASVSQIATQDITPTSHPLPLVNVTRADVVVPGLSHAEAALRREPAVARHRDLAPLSPALGDLALTGGKERLERCR